MSSAPLLLPALPPLLLAVADPACDFDAELAESRAADLFAALADALLVAPADAPFLDDASFLGAAGVRVFFVSALSGAPMSVFCAWNGTCSVEDDNDV